jgi:hypothetical protein
MTYLILIAIILIAMALLALQQQRCACGGIFTDGNGYRHSSCNRCGARPSSK